MDTVYEVATSKYLVSINPTVLGSEDQATMFNDPQSVCNGLNGPGGEEAFRVGRPKTPQHF